jgi:hypothetical protein
MDDEDVVAPIGEQFHCAPADELGAADDENAHVLQRTILGVLRGTRFADGLALVHPRRRAILSSVR